MDDHPFTSIDMKEESDSVWYRFCYLNKGKEVIQMPSKESKINPHVFTRRERTILNLVAEGYRNDEIANQLDISRKTVRENQINLMRKLNAPNVSSVIDHALDKGLIDIYEVLESRFAKMKPEAN